MPYLVTAVIIVGVLCLLDLLLTFAVVRRLRETGERLATLESVMSPPIRRAGEAVGAFAATTVDGHVVSEHDISPGTLVGFLSPGCAGCAVQLPEFLEVARAHPAGPAGILAVVVGDQAGSAEYVDVLAPLARVVVVPLGHDVEKAFAVQSFPAFAVVGRGGVVQVSGPTPAVLSVAANA
jgi:thiol-disulfide isomerase/thioredoxin